MTECEWRHGTPKSRNEAVDINCSCFAAPDIKPPSLGRLQVLAKGCVAGPITGGVGLGVATLGMSWGLATTYLVLMYYIVLLRVQPFVLLFVLIILYRTFVFYLASMTTHRCGERCRMQEKPSAAHDRCRSEMQHSI